MINTAVGTERRIDDRSWIETNKDAAGHAIYGPYRHLGPGQYAVTFKIASREALGAGWRNPVVAELDVTIDGGQQKIAGLPIHSKDLATDPRDFTIGFTLDQGSVVEYRVFVSGTASLVVEDLPHCWAVPEGETIEASAVQQRFPVLSEATPLLRSVEPSLRHLHARGAQIAADGDAAIVLLDNVAFHVQSRDDLNLVHELFDENVYDVSVDAPVCAIDVGMNIALATLRFAAKPFIEEVHSFEPFASTYARARANIDLNPTLAGKITTYNFGLGSRDEVVEIAGDNGGDSGSFNIFHMSGGDTKQVIEVRDAATMLRPIIAEARAAGRKIVLKIDCEGAEFAVFESLAAAGLFEQIGAVMVEWHMMFAGKTQATLIAPLLRAGFFVFDRSPPEGNGMFYAAKIA